jgi:hypothetical protein
MNLRKWFVVSALFILSIGFTIIMDLLLGLDLNASIQTIFSPFRFMREGEVALIMITLLYVLVLEVLSTRRTKR